MKFFKSFEWRTVNDYSNIYEFLYQGPSISAAIFLRHVSKSFLNIVLLNNMNNLS